MIEKLEEMKEKQKVEEEGMNIQAQDDDQISIPKNSANWDESQQTQSDAVKSQSSGEKSEDDDEHVVQSLDLMQIDSEIEPKKKAVVKDPAVIAKM